MDKKKLNILILIAGIAGILGIVAGLLISKRKREIELMYDDMDSYLDTLIDEELKESYAEEDE